MEVTDYSVQWNRKRERKKWLHKIIVTQYNKGKIKMIKWNLMHLIKIDCEEKINK